MYKVDIFIKQMWDYCLMQSVFLYPTKQLGNAESLLHISEAFLIPTTIRLDPPRCFNLSVSY